MSVGGDDSNIARMERKLPQPGFWMAALLAFLVLVLQTCLTTPLAVLDIVMKQVLHRTPLQLDRQPLALVAINIISFGAIIALGLRLNRLSFWRAFPVSGMTALQLAGIIITILGADVLLSEVDNLFRAVLPMPQVILSLMEDLFLDEEKLFSRILLLVIVAPLTEELLFRGIILRGLLNRHRPAVAVGLSALLFALTHCNPWQFLSALCLGLLLGWIYVRSGSLLLCVCGHALSNGFSILATLVPVEIPGMTGSHDFTTVAFQPWWFDLTGFGLLLIGLWIFRKATPQIQEQLGRLDPS